MHLPRYWLPLDLLSLSAQSTLLVFIGTCTSTLFQTALISCFQPSVCSSPRTWETLPGKSFFPETTVKIPLVIATVSLSLTRKSSTGNYTKGREKVNVNVIFFKIQVCSHSGLKQ